MKKLILVFVFFSILFCGCNKQQAAILFNRQPITEKNIYDYSKAFPIGSRIYYVILMPQKVESRYLYIQVVKKDNDYGRLGYDLIWTRDVRLSDEEVNYFTDYFVINQKGYYVMKVYSKDNPHKMIATSEFYVGN